MSVIKAIRAPWLGVLAPLLLALGCHRQHFEPAKFQSNELLFEASLQKLKQRHWDDAQKGFERLTTNLPARDPLLPPSLYYLGQAYQGRHEYLLAAQSFSRVPEAFPEDSLAAAATYETGMSYARLWRKPSLDSDYGQTALATLQSFLAAYPDSPLKGKADAEIAHLNEWLAEKNYDEGMFYFRRKAYDPSLIYFKDVVRLYPETRHARLALLRMVGAYRKISYKEEVAETCATLRGKYPNDRDVRDACGPAPATASAPRTP